MTLVLLPSTVHRYIIKRHCRHETAVRYTSATRALHAYTQGTYGPSAWHVNMYVLDSTTSRDSGINLRPVALSE